MISYHQKRFLYKKYFLNPKKHKNDSGKYKKKVFETLKNVEMIMGSCKFGWHGKKEWSFVGI